MKLTSLLPPAAAVVLMTAAVLASTSGVQATQDQPPATPPAARNPTGAAMQGPRPMRSYPAPTNLQVLPKDLTGAQVHEIMEGFAGSLGVHCDFCHAADPKNLMPNGRPRMDFADDSKDDKKIARIMIAMVQQINSDYISKSKALDPDSMGMKVTCGTCHRGHQMPEEFVIPEGPGPGGPPPAGGPPVGAPPAAAPPPAN
jgi:Photosynthetic reaction centre cytochrome C subunit